QRILAERGDDGTVLPALPVPLADRPALLTGADPETQLIALVDLHSVGSEVDVAAVGIPVDQHAARAEIPSTIARVEKRSGIAPQVDGVAGQHVLQQRAVPDDDRRDRPGLLELARGEADQL